MSKTTFKLISLFLFLGIFILVNGPVLAKEAIQVVLVYPQKSNSIKREGKRIERPMVLKGVISIDVAGVNPKQLKNPDVYLEYFLDGQLIYSSEKKAQPNVRPSLLSFVLDTRLYANGAHSLVVNLWDKKGPSAIGIRQVIIQNEAKK